MDENIKLCLLCLNPETEDKVIENNKRFVERGGRFASIFVSGMVAMAWLVRASMTVSVPPCSSET